MMPALEMEMTPRTYECGPDRRIRLHHMMKHLQEIASNHAERMGVGMNWMQENGLIWVLTDMRMSISRYPEWNEYCTIYTMPSGYDELRAYREFLITGSDDEEIMKSTSVWMVLDVDKKIPVRTSELEFDFPEKGKRSFGNIVRNRPTGEIRGIHSVRMGDSSIDMNGHVNNTEYVRWSMDALAMEGMEASGIRDLLLSYRAEVFVNDILESCIGKGNDCLMLALKRKGTTNPAFTMEIY